MTDKVNPSITRPAEAFKTAGAISLAGGSGGWISPSAEPSDISVQDGGINDGVLNAFSQASGSTSFDVTIDPGEAFVYGSWLAIDTATVVTLSSNTASQTLYVGWNKDSSDDVIIGLQSAFDNASGNTDQKIPLYDFDTDGSGVTSVTDRRTIGKTLDGRYVNNTASISADYTTSGEQLIFADSSGGPLTITLSEADLDNGSNVIIADSGGAAGTNNITIDTAGSSNINGANSILVENEYSAKAIGTDGTNWYTTGAGGGGNLSAITIDTDKDWQNFDIFNVRKFSAEDGVINGKTLETGDTLVIENDESMVVSESYTVDGDLTIEAGGSVTVI